MDFILWVAIVIALLAAGGYFYLCASAKSEDEGEG